MRVDASAAAIELLIEQGQAHKDNLRAAADSLRGARMPDGGCPAGRELAATHHTAIVRLVEVAGFSLAGDLVHLQRAYDHEQHGCLAGPSTPPAVPKAAAWFSTSGIGRRGVTGLAAVVLAVFLGMAVLLVVQRGQLAELRDMWRGARPVAAATEEGGR
jgi:hypothetical protein